MTEHRHTKIGHAICRFIPCLDEIERAREESRAALRELVAAERELLYDLIDNGHREDSDDELLGLIARNGGTDKGRVRRAPRITAADIEASRAQDALYQRRPPHNRKNLG